MSEQNNIGNNKRIAKNTIFLYIRQLFLMIIGLFTSRVILNSLGVDDYGVYNVVGGVVAMFTLFTGSLSNSISRFLAVGIGQGDRDNLGIIFSTSVSIQVVMALVVGLLLEIGGVWFLNTHLNIPIGRMYAANWVLQFSILTFCVNIISVPYNAAIIAHEKMSAFAYASILEGIFKLIVAYSLYITSFDKLITYGFLLMIVSVVMRIIYGIYCKRTFEECHYCFVLNKNLIKEMTSFAGWNFFGSGAYLFNTQGVNIVTNIFFGVATNAARGVATQAEGIIKHLVTNFTTAINPQIMKSYASGNLDYMYALVCKGAKFSYFLMFIFFVPFMFETESIMNLWLKNYPTEAPLFLRLSMIGTMFDMLGNATANAAWATGKIKKYYLYVATIGCLVFPLSWGCFFLGCGAYSSYVVFAFVYFVLIFVKLWIINGLIQFPISLFFKEVILKITYTSIVAFVIPSLFYFTLSDSLLKSLFVIFIAIVSACCSIYSLGLTMGERKMVYDKILSKLKKQ